MSDSFLATIQRCPHDRENPYAMINTSLIRDENISPECRWMLIYLLSMKDGWQIRVSQVYSHVKKFIGRDKVYKLFDEAVEAGYIKKEVIIKSNLNSGCVYYVSESPKFKNCFRHPEFQDPERQDPENQDLSNIISSSEEVSILKHKKEKEEGASPPPPAPPVSLFAFKKVSMKQEDYDKLVTDYGEITVKEKIEALDDYGDINPKRFKQYSSHSAVIRSWIRKDLSKIKIEHMPDTSQINDVRKENLRLNDELVRELKLDYPEMCATMTIYHKSYLLKSKNPYFDISLLVDHKEFCRFLEKYLKIRILEVRFPNG